MQIPTTFVHISLADSRNISRAAVRLVRYDYLAVRCLGGRTGRIRRRAPSVLCRHNPSRRELFPVVCKIALPQRTQRAAPSQRLHPRYRPALHSGSQRGFVHRLWFDRRRLVLNPKFILRSQQQLDESVCPQDSNAGGKSPDANGNSPSAIVSTSVFTRIAKPGDLVVWRTETDGWHPHRARPLRQRGNYRIVGCRRQRPYFCALRYDGR